MSKAPGYIWYSFRSLDESKTSLSSTLLGGDPRRTVDQLVWLDSLNVVKVFRSSDLGDRLGIAFIRPRSLSAQRYSKRLPISFITCCKSEGAFFAELVIGINDCFLAGGESPGDTCESLPIFSKPSRLNSDHVNGNIPSLSYCQPISSFLLADLRKLMFL